MLANFRRNIVSDFDSNTVADKIRGLEPGDDVKFRVEFKNSYKTTTSWYMRNEVLTTLEESFDRTENGGYTYRLVHIQPDGTRQVLFDNSEVGGEAKVAGMEGLHAAIGNGPADYVDLDEGSVPLAGTDEADASGVGRLPLLIGSAAGVLIVLALIAFLLRRRRMS